MGTSQSKSQHQGRVTYTPAGPRPDPGWTRLLPDMLNSSTSRVRQRKCCFHADCLSSRWWHEPLHVQETFWSKSARNLWKACSKMRTIVSGLSESLLLLEKLVALTLWGCLTLCWCGTQGREKQDYHLSQVRKDQLQVILGSFLKQRFRVPSFCYS